jgi:hypothetical protein
MQERGVPVLSLSKRPANKTIIAGMARSYKSFTSPARQRREMDYFNEPSLIRS